MENETNIQKRIDELKITEEDLYFLSHIEGIKATAGIFKEKYNKYMYGILKKNNVNSIDFLMISRYVKNKKFHLIPELIEKYGSYQLDISKTSYDFKGMKAFASIIIVIIVVFFVFKQTNNSSKGNNSTNSSINNSASEELSKKAYRAGYNDGQRGNGLPASERATAMESYMAHNYNFSSADIPVYEMGYNDAISGKSAEY